VISALRQYVTNYINPARLTGPIFDKELRVSSRRRRNYVLRFLYLVLLMVFIFLVWLSTVRVTYASTSYQISRMSQAGLAIIATITGFQFFATQLIAVIMLSTAISDEIYHKTLGVLMTTPINSFQIVMGKLFSKLYQIILLLAISLPLLAIVRVFGGVPWGFIVSSLCVTLTAVIFAGSLSLFFSIYTRRAYAVIARTGFTMLAIFAILPGIATAALIYQFGMIEEFVYLVPYVNPFAAMQYLSMSLIAPGGMGATPFTFYWPVHCIIMLGASVAILAVSVKVVRKAALRQATGQPDPYRKSKRRKQKLPAPTQTNTSGKAKTSTTAAAIRPVKGSPVLWKETRAPFIQGGKKTNLIGIALIIFAMLITYIIAAWNDYLHEETIHIIYSVIFVLMGLLTNTTLSAASITTEKEARSWPILLATPLDDCTILWGKAVGVFRRCLPIWLFLAGHVLLFTLRGYIHPITIIHLAMLIIWIVIFLSCTGLYFSARFQRTTTAVVANFGLALFLWGIVPFLLGLCIEIWGETPLETFVMGNPFIQSGVIMEGAAGHSNARLSLAALNYDWPMPGRHGVGATSLVMIASLVFYTFLGFLFAWRAKCRFRKNIF